VEVSPRRSRVSYSPLANSVNSVSRVPCKLTPCLSQARALWMARPQHGKIRGYHGGRRCGVEGRGVDIHCDKGGWVPVGGDEGTRRGRGGDETECEYAYEPSCGSVAGEL
jgi:hypothetical protein